jgi:Ca-activated chloride channel family protein
MFGSLTYLHAERIHWLWPALLLVLVLGWLELRRRDALSQFVSRAMQTRLARRATAGRRIMRLSLVFACFLSSIVALMRPQTRADTETVSSGRVTADIMIALDVSKSMLAEDAAPNRLARAKAEIGDLVSQLDGHRIGLVAFAGRAAVLSPLTSDYGFFRMILRGADTNSVSRGGTRIGDALRAAIKAFPPGKGSKLILLITDGEDHDSFAADAAKEALEAGVRVVAIGFGSEEGSQITLVDPETGARRILTDKSGAPVVSRLDGELLRQIALTTEGAYVPAGVAALDLESIVNAHIEPLAQQSAEPSVRVVPGEQYPWFVLGALLSLLGAVWVGSATTETRDGLR